MIRGNIIFSEKAETDIYAIVRWYDDQKEDLGDKFLRSLDEVLIRVRKHPSAFRYIAKDVRRCKTEKFPYYIYFSHMGGITILRVRHIRQASLKRFT